MTIKLRNQNRIDGKWSGPSSGQYYEIHNPADLREVIHQYPLSSSQDVEVAVMSASKAMRKWQEVPIAQKAAIMRRVGSLIEQHRDQIAQLITAENGKLLSESNVEIDSTISELNFQVGEGERQFGLSNRSHNGSALGITRKEPLGVISAIIPWNFPFNVPFRKLVPALMAGNTAILKPASQTAGVGELVIHLLTEAGLPADALQLVTGAGGELSDALVTSPAIRAVTFTGSTNVGRLIAEKAASGFVKTQLEMGGKNPAIVLASADIEKAAELVVTGAFSCAGQWCTATSRLIVEKSIYNDLVDKILQRVAKLKLGRGTEPDATMGPVCGKAQLSSVLERIDLAKMQGGRLLCGGGRKDTEGLEHGCFIQPTIFALNNSESDLSREEVFGPVLAIETAQNYEDAINLANSVRYGLSSSIFTNDLTQAMDFIERTEAGLTHVNMHSAYKEPQFAFGGVKESGFGLPEAGSLGIQFFQEEKTIYIQ